MTEAIHRTVRHTDAQHDGPNKVRILSSGTLVSERPVLDLIAGSGTSLAIVDDPVNNKVTVTVTASGGAPGGPAGGQLNGTFPNPGVNDTHGQTGTQTHHAQDHAGRHQPGGADAMAVDAAAGTGSLRTLGTGASQAVAGNDSRLSDSRTPTAHHATHEVAGSDAVAVTHAQTTGQTANDHHAQVHSHASHTGIGTDDHHAEVHTIGGGDHIGSITSAQHGTIASGNLHPEYATDADLSAYVPVIGVQDEGVAQGTVSTLNFHGDWVTAVVDGSTATVTISEDLDALELRSELAFEREEGELEWLT